MSILCQGIQRYTLNSVSTTQGLPAILSQFYPKGSEEKRLLDAMLLAYPK